MTPKVSVLLPVYNGERFIAEAIQSILTQSFENWELLVLDDGSTDRSMAVAEGFADRRIRAVRLAHSGLARTLNIGLHLSSGAYIARQDADDVSLPSRFALQVEGLEADPALVLVGSGMRLVDEAGRLVKDYVYPMEHRSLVRMLREGINPFPHSSVMLRRESLVAVGGWNEIFQRSQDLELYLRMSEVVGWRLMSIRQPLVRVRYREDSITHRRGDTKYAFMALLLAELRRKLGSKERAQHVLQELLPLIEIYHRRRCARYDEGALCYKKARIALARRDYGDFVVKALKAVSLDPLYLGRRLTGSARTRAEVERFLAVALNEQGSQAARRSW